MKPQTKQNLFEYRNARHRKPHAVHLFILHEPVGWCCLHEQIGFRRTLHFCYKWEDTIREMERKKIEFVLIFFFCSLNFADLYNYRHANFVWALFCATAPIYWWIVVVDRLHRLRSRFVFFIVLNDSTEQRTAEIKLNFFVIPVQYVRWWFDVFFKFFSGSFIGDTVE